MEADLPTLDQQALAGLQTLEAHQPGFLKQVIDVFVSNAEQKVAEMREACIRSDQPSLRSEAHSLKGSSGQVGAVRVGQLAAWIETHGEPTTAPAVLIQMEQELAQAVAALRALCGS